jgi:hypothetical protein
MPQKLKQQDCCVSVAHTTSEVNLEINLNILLIVLSRQSIPPLEHVLMLNFSGLAFRADPPRSTYIEEVDDRINYGLRFNPLNEGGVDHVCKAPREGSHCVLQPVTTLLYS